MDKICRVCRSSDANLINLFAKSNESENELSLAAMINGCLGNFIHPEDKFPQQICLSCVWAARSAYRFKLQFEESHRHFSELLRVNDNFYEDFKNFRHFLTDSNLVETNENLLKFKTEDNSEGNVSHVQSKSRPTSNEDGPDGTAQNVHQKKPTAIKIEDKCPQCPKIFRNAGNLKRHLLIHSGERPFKCKHCPKAFNQNSHLATHARVHSGERPFQCQHCNKCFIQKGHLINHVKIHSGAPSFKCSTCEEGFVQKSHLLAHMDVCM